MYKLKNNFGSCSSKFKMVLLLIPAVLAIEPVSAQQTRTLTVDEAVSIALENNREIQISEYNVEAAESGLREITGSFFPQISVSGQYTRNVKKPVIFLGDGMGFPGGGGGGPSTLEIGSNNSFQLSVSANIPIYSRQLFKSRQAAISNQELSEVDLQSIKNDIAADVKRTYYTILLNQKVVEFTQQRIENAREHLENVQRLKNEGLSTEFDILVAEVQVENLIPELIQAENEVDYYKLQLMNLLSLEATDSLQLSGSLEPEKIQDVNRDNLLNVTLNNNYQLKLLESQLDIVETNIAIEQAALFPTLSGFGNYNYLTEDDSFDFADYQWINTAAVGLSLQIPIFSGNSNRERINQARINLKQVEEQRLAAEEQIETEFTNVVNRLKQIQRRIDATERAMEQAQRAYNLATLRFEQGLGTQVEINDSELAHANARFNNLQALFDYQITMVTLEQLQGKLITN